MKNIAQFLQLAVLVYFLLFLIFFYSHNSIGSAFGMDPLTAESMVKVFLTGLLLFLAAWIAARLRESKTNEQIRKMQEEMNGLKAKLYDYEHPKVVTAPKPAAPQPTEEPSANLRPRQNFTD
jgi:hypothetical protein